MKLPARLTGIFTPNIVPLTDAGEIHETRLREYIDWLIAKGVHGLYPNGSTGEFPRFSAEERRRIIAIVVDAAAGRVPVLAGAAEANVRETIRACEYYYELGARAVAIVAPYYYRLSPSSVEAYFADIARHSPIDVTLYNIPMFASPIDIPTIARLAAEYPRIVGIKDSSGDLPHMTRMIAAVRPIRPDFSFLTGWEAALVPMLLMGCDGGTHATSGVVPEVTRRLFDLCQQKEWEAAARLQAAMLPLFDAMITGVEFPDGFRLGVKARGFDMGTGRQPLGGDMGDRLKAAANAIDRLLPPLLDAAKE